jgi:hypothetical protein
MLTFGDSLIPRLYRVQQHEIGRALEEPETTVRQGMAPWMNRIKAGDRIGIAVGSRGIFWYARIVKAVADNVKQAGGQPFLIPAMGSHGGATAVGQTAVLAGYGITEESMGAPILSSMETVVLGHTSQNMPVYFDKNAYGLDGVIMVNRVKPHTDFRSVTESGVVKQMVIGLGKHNGASAVHRHGIVGLANIIREAAQIVLEQAPILMGVAILENAQDRTARIEAIPSEQMLEREPQLLEDAKGFMPVFPVAGCDVLVLQEMGKNISGTGIDPNIVGRYLIRHVEDQEPDIYRIVCLDLTPESHGNAIGVGICDVITRRLYEKIDLSATYVNVLTSGFLERGFIPIIAESDQDAVEISLHCCNRFVTKENARLIFAKSSLDLSRLVVSEALLPELRQRAGIEILEEIDPVWWKDGSLDSLF